MRCSVAQCLDVVGEWWSLLIVRDALRDNLMAALNTVVYLDDEEASERMSSREWTYEDMAKHPERYK